MPPIHLSRGYAALAYNKLMSDSQNTKKKAIPPQTGDIDFRPLNNLPRLHLTPALFRLALSSLLILIVLPLLIVLPVYFSPSLNDLVTPVISTYAFAAVTALSLIGLLLYFRYRIDAQTEKVFLEFARRNGYAYREAQDFKGSPGSVFDKSLHRTRFLNRPEYDFNGQYVIEGTWRGLPFCIFVYRYFTTTIGRGRRFMVMSVSLPKQFPQILIDSHNESFDGSLIPTGLFEQRQRFELEGDFPSYFSVYTPDKRGTDALQILAPDVMRALVDSAQNCDMEIVRNQMYFYWPQQKPSTELYEKMFMTAGRVLSEARRPLGILKTAPLQANHPTRALVTRLKADAEEINSTDIRIMEQSEPKKPGANRLKKRTAFTLGSILFTVFVLLLIALDPIGAMDEARLIWDNFASNWQNTVASFLVSVLLIAGFVVALVVIGNHIDKRRAAQKKSK